MEDTIISPHIKTTVMRRVKIIWFLRRVLPFLALEIVASMYMLSKIAEQVFVNHVLQNAAVHTFTRSPIMFADFFLRAFVNTEIAVQTLVIVSLVGGILITRDASRTLRAFVIKQQRNLSQLSHVI